MVDRIHELKAEKFFFRALADWDKTFEVRLNDRNFQVGDYLLIKEWDPANRTFTGEEFKTQISFILYGDQDEAIKNGYPRCFFEGVKPGYVVIGF